MATAAARWRSPAASRSCRKSRSEEEARQHELLHGLRFAEERQGLADQIAYDMSSRPDLDKVPGPVLDFLYGPWALAMAHARLVDRDRQIDPRGYGLVQRDRDGPARKRGALSRQ